MARKGRGAKSRAGLPFGVKRMPNDRFQARVAIGRKVRHLGTFGSAEEASGVATAAKFAALAESTATVTPITARRART